MYPGEVIMKKVELRMNEQNKYEIIMKIRKEQLLSLDVQ